ncbi:MAG: hypothetical protein IJR68_00905, partial [Fretibacterium sp.]|nr:hypothetical protein [Fretibacterium sp.]
MFPAKKRRKSGNSAVRGERVPWSLITLEDVQQRIDAAIAKASRPETLSFVVVLRIAQDKPGKSYSSDMWIAGYKRQKGKARILEDDRIRVYGTCKGTYTYQSALGGPITVPA